ncbi:restriction endonuclease subunit S [Clostridium tetani]|uniref:restriction endonuclease subunit S n=1 Tax=Clostridium tetani TaxID=1513 RepID=UPI00100A877E|nr:restriction endonuclease subunit S [Clostridium tetani]RXM69301.1 restriction endonuclease subunit S [Clostridium tetani]
MEKNNNKPKLRFPGFTDPWEQRKLGEITNSIDTGRSKFVSNSNGEYEILGSTSVIGYDDNYDYEGDFLLTARVGANAGELYRHSGRVKISDNTVFIQGKNLNFIFYMLMNFDIKKLSFGTGQPLIKASELRELELMLPKSSEEQQKIGTFFNSLDNLITLHQRKLNHLQDKKKGLLQKMFPKNGERFPELRFPGFTEAWEQRKLKQLANFAKGRGYSKNDLTDVGTPIILYGRLYTKYQSTISEVDTFVVPKSGSVYSTGEEVIVPASGETAEDIARASAVVKSDFLLGGDLNIIYPNKDISTVFLALSISNGKQQKELSKRAQGKSVVHLRNSDLEEVTISFPCRDEQERIGSLFEYLDNLITLHQRKLEHLQQQKKGLLQQMFI